MPDHASAPTDAPAPGTGREPAHEPARDPDPHAGLELLARGRDADVYALDDTTVLRRVRVPEASRTLHEARVMTHLAEHGFPVPQVHHADATSIVMQRLTGPTLLEHWFARPWTLRANARMLAALHDLLAAVPAPDWLEPADGEAAHDTEVDTGTDAGGGTPAVGGLARPGGTQPARRSVLHLDLHPGNVILTPDGPTVIDWTTAAAGDSALDLAKTLVTIATADLPARTQRLARAAYVRALRRASAADPRPRTADAIRTKLRDPNLSAAETARLHALLARETRGHAPD
jgi:aminoglycoside phosphotransferase (APT) family kinase protein